MTTRRTLFATALASALVLAMSPMPAPIYMNIPAGEVLKTRVEFKQPVLCDGSVRLEKGFYDLTIRSKGDGTVLATFNGDGKTGHASGKVQGHEIVVQGGLQPAAANAVVVQGGKQPNAPAAPPSFATLGFTPQSRALPQVQGNHLNVIVHGEGTNQILIGLLLPAVQKVREAASSPAH